jgi:hypothetical protein
MTPLKGHREEHSDVAISWRTLATGLLRHVVPRNDNLAAALFLESASK